ncbi:hypothetical protein FB645_001962 [Coemansia sp. IMI 203386]|nr:hypothetical protein FB645_001962 [Coemansia sp. IMI 203386]
MADLIRQRHAFNSSSSEQKSQQQSEQQQTEQQQQQQSPSEQQSGGKATGTKRSLTIAIGGVLALLGVASYTFMRSPASVDQVSVITATPTPAQITTALESVATKRSDAQKKLQTISRTERKAEAKKLKELSELEVTALLRKNEKTWGAIDGALQVDTNQVSSNDPIEDYLISGDLKADGGSKYMVGVFDGHAGFVCAEQLSKRMGPMIDSALASIGGGNKGSSAALNKAVVKLTRNPEHKWDPLPMALTASFIAMDNELVHDSLAEFKRLKDMDRMDELLGPAVAGSCGLVAVVDKDADEVVVANTGDSRALLGVRLDNGKWKAVRLSEDHTADNKMELERLARDHPGEVVMRKGRVLGALMPTRAFGDCRYKWPMDVQQALFPTLLARGHKYATSPPDYNTPPYVTAHPVIVRHKLSKNDRFIVVASDGLYDQMPDADIVDTVAQWYEARDPKSGLITQDKNAATHLIRAALSTDRMGQRNDNLIRQLLAIPPPVSRRFRDDISVSIVTLNEKQEKVTGASSGIGEACAYQFAAAGANVILTARRADRLCEVQNKISASWPKVSVHTATLDVRSSTEVEKVISSIPSELSSIDILVNNAGLALGVKPLINISNEEIDTMIDTNVKGLLYVTRAVLQGMKERKSGHIIMMGSIAGLSGYINGSIYCATKSAVRAITESLRAETIGVPIKVTEIKPGMVETEFSVVRYGGDRDKASAVYKGIEPMTAEDVAETVVFAASRHPRCVVADVVMLANGQASATLSHRNE